MRLHKNNTYYKGAVTPKVLENIWNVTEGHEQYFGLAQDASSDEIEKCFPVLGTYDYPETGLTVADVLDMIYSMLNTSQKLFDATNNALSKHNVGWNKCATYLGDNAANIQGKHNSILS